MCKRKKRKKEGKKEREGREEKEGKEGKKEQKSPALSLLWNPELRSSLGMRHTRCAGSVHLQGLLTGKKALLANVWMMADLSPQTFHPKRRG